MSETAQKRRIMLVFRCFVRRNKRLLLLKRSPSDPSNPDLWEAPGGKFDENEDFLASHEREVLEETGLLVAPAKLCAHAETLMIEGGRYHGIPYVAIFSLFDTVGGELKLSEEHTESALVSYDQMLGLELTPQVRRAAVAMREILAEQ